MYKSFDGKRRYWEIKTAYFARSSPGHWRTPVVVMTPALHHVTRSFLEMNSQEQGHSGTSRRLGLHLKYP